MRRIISENLATRGLILVFALAIVFHLLVLAGIVPMDMVWGGILRERQELIRLEVFSITVNAIFLVAMCIYAGVL